MWGFIFGGMLVLAILGVIYLWTRFKKFGIVKKLAGEKKWLLNVLAMIPLLIFGICFALDYVNTGIVLVHMSVYWALAELIAALIRKLRGKKASGAAETDQTEETKKASGKDEAAGKKGFQPYIVGILVLCFELSYFSVGWVLDHHVWKKEYQLTTEKDLGMEKLRIALIADSHVGTTFDGEGFARHLKTIEAENPDVLVISGDFVDDDTSKEDMYRCCMALAGFQCKYGVYFVYGNHDKGYFNYRNFTAEELKNALDAAGVQVMQDEVQLVDGKFYIVGRQDKSVRDRISIDKIMPLLDPSKYAIVLDHQPADYDAEAAAGADLVLSGHTHGGQMLEINMVGALIGANDRTYGLETRDKTDFIVTSGISDWRIKFKTGTSSEYCIIEVVQK